jgi:DNA-binding NtrC family response regulator
MSDVPSLVDHLITTTSARFGLRRKELSPGALNVLMAYDWKRNNVRELRNVVERMIIATDGETIGAEQVPQEIRDDGTPTPSSSGTRTFLELKAEAERQIVAVALERNAWHITKTAQELGLADHSSLLKIMRRHALIRES